MLFTSFFPPPPPLPPALHDHHSAAIISHNCYVHVMKQSYLKSAYAIEVVFSSHSTCNTKNVIYMVQCNRCNLQYICETKRRLKEHFLSL